MFNNKQENGGGKWEDNTTQNSTLYFDFSFQVDITTTHHRPPPPPLFHLYKGKKKKSQKHTRNKMVKFL